MKFESISPYYRWSSRSERISERMSQITYRSASDQMGALTARYLCAVVSVLQSSALQSARERREIQASAFIISPGILSYIIITQAANWPRATCYIFALSSKDDGERDESRMCATYRSDVSIAQARSLFYLG